MMITNDFFDCTICRLFGGLFAALFIFTHKKITLFRQNNRVYKMIFREKYFNFIPSEIHFSVPFLISKNSIHLFLKFAISSNITFLLIDLGAGNYFLVICYSFFAFTVFMALIVGILTYPEGFGRYIAGEVYFKFF